MTMTQTVLTIAICAAATALTRFLPFLLFPAGRQTPRAIQYLGRVLPYSVIGLLIVYCLKGVNVLRGSRGLPEAIAIAAICLVHVWKRNVLLSIATGTVLYMVLIQLVFQVT